VSGSDDPGNSTRRDFLSTAFLALGAIPLLGRGPFTAGGAHLEDYTETIPGTTVTFEMKAIPGNPRDGIAPFWIARTEVTWDAFLLWVYADSHVNAGTPDADGITHPTKPYGDVYRGYGRRKQPALGMSHQAAVEFCTWLSKQTGRRYRLPTEAEWEYACRAGTATPFFWGNAPGDAKQFAWHGGTSDGKPRPVGTTQPNPWGLYDMAGNVAEWCAAPADGTPPAVRGGHFRGGTGLLRSDARLVSDAEAWNALDPQQPKSRWWLASVDFTGFRLACSPSQEPS
jgi:sulfatase modifying factor 1